MKKHWLVLAAVVGLAIGDACRAMDTVKTTKGSFSGRVVAMTPEKVDLEQGANATTKEIAVNQIQTVFYENEPTGLQTAKTHVLAGRFAEALTALDRIKASARRPEIEQDVDFYKALCAAKLALAGSGKVADAGRAMKAFVDANGKSYHFFEAAETLGDLLVAVGQYGPAAEYYAQLEKAPWPDYKMRAGVAAGRALLAQGKPEQAEAAFDKVIASPATGKLAESQWVLARLGKASALAAAKKSDDAIQIIDEILKTADADDVPLKARAYNVLGTAYRQAGRTTDALLAFLRVDQLYASVPDTHAEALANLAELWQQVHKMDRANLARRTLREQYGDSPWAKKSEEREGREERGE